MTETNRVPHTGAVLWTLYRGGESLRAQRRCYEERRAEVFKNGELLFGKLYALDVPRKWRLTITAEAEQKGWSHEGPLTFCSRSRNRIIW